MATTPVKFIAPSGLTLTLALYPTTSDTASASVSGTEATNCKGLYSASVVDLAAATYYARIRLAEGTVVGRGVLEHANTTGTERVKSDAAATAASVDAGDIWGHTNRTLTQEV